MAFRHKDTGLKDSQKNIKFLCVTSRLCAFVSIHGTSYEYCYR